MKARSDQYTPENCPRQKQEDSLKFKSKGQKQQTPDTQETKMILEKRMDKSKVYNSDQPNGLQTAQKHPSNAA